jgi:hypothetical protein
MAQSGEAATKFTLKSSKWRRLREQEECRENPRRNVRFRAIVVHAFSQTWLGKRGFATTEPPAGYVRCDQHVGSSLWIAVRMNRDSSVRETAAVGVAEGVKAVMDVHLKVKAGSEIPRDSDGQIQRRGAKDAEGEGRSAARSRLDSTNRKQHRLDLELALPRSRRRVKVLLMKGKVSSAAGSRSQITPKRDDLQICIITGWRSSSGLRFLDDAILLV